MTSGQKTGFTIGDLATQSGCKVETVRYYEKTGVMPDPPRTEGGHRIYSLDHLKRLVFIRRSRGLGFSIDQVRNLLRFVDEPDHTCGEVRDMAMQQVQAAQKKIDDLKHLQKALREMSARCKGGRYKVEDCPIVDALFENKNEG
jgi:MerR family mercuric resistance operon transcriptional regulator